MDQVAVHASGRRRVLTGWLAAACGIMTFGTHATASLGAEPHGYGNQTHRAGQFQSSTAGHARGAIETTQGLGASSFQRADTGGLWTGYHRDNCENCQAVQPAVEGSDCGCDHRRVTLRHTIYRVLDGFAGGIEQAMGLDQRGQMPGEANCDDGCDAGMLSELRQLDAHAVPMVKHDLRSVEAEPPARIGAETDDAPTPPQPTSEPVAPPKRPVPAPVLPDAKIDPFADEASWIPGRNPAIERSAYFE